MDLRKALLSILQLFSAFSFFVAALICLSLPLLPKACIRMADLLLSSPKSFIPMGIGLLAASFVLFAGFYSFHRERNLHIQMGEARATIVDPKVVQKTLEDYLRLHFTHQIALSHLRINQGNRLEIGVSLHSLEEGTREHLFVILQEKIPPLLQERFAYSKPFTLVVKV